MDIQTLEEALLPWLRVDTWYTPHPLDSERFHKAIQVAFTRLGPRIGEEDMGHAIRNVLAKRHPGQEKMTEQIDKFIRRADIIGCYLADTSAGR